MYVLLCLRSGLVNWLVVFTKVPVVIEEHDRLVHELIWNELNVFSEWGRHGTRRPGSPVSHNVDCHIGMPVGDDFGTNCLGFLLSKEIRIG